MGVYSSSGQPHIYAATYDGHKWTVEDPFAKTASTVLPATTKGAGTVLNSEISSMHQSKGLGYVAFGDSITTGQSIANCQDNRLLSPWGCLPGDLPAMPYPNRVAAALGYKYQDSVIWYQQALPFLPTTGLVRVGIWGATLQAATQAQRQKHNSSGAWVPQLLAVQQTQGLVTGSLGVNDLHFSDVVKWVKLYFQPGNDHITPAVQEIIQQRAADFDAMFDALKIAKSNGAKVIVTLYYNPYDTASNSCQDLRSIGATIVNNLDDELMRRSQQAGLRVADFRPAFQGHGAGSSTRYVFGKQCSAISAIADWLPSWMGGGGGQQNLARGFDPHPNNSGTAAMATAILKEYER
jgi:lysophospholipase L1-like esterase